MDLLAHDWWKSIWSSSYWTRSASSKFRWSVRQSVNWSESEFEKRILFAMMRLVMNKWSKGESVENSILWILFTEGKKKKWRRTLPFNDSLQIRWKTLNDIYHWQIWYITQKILTYDYKNGHLHLCLLSFTDAPVDHQYNWLVRQQVSLSTSSKWCDMYKFSWVRLYFQDKNKERARHTPVVNQQSILFPLSVSFLCLDFWRW